MTKSTKISKRSGGVKQIVLGTGLSVGALILCSMLSAAILLTRDNPTAEVGIYALITLIVAASASGAIVPKLTDGIPGGLICALVTSVAILAVGLIAGGGAPFGAFMNCICYLGTFALCAVLMKMRKKRVVRKRHRRR